MEEQFLRTEMLLGSGAMERLRRSHVAVVGLGGVGSWCAEALCRAGVGALTLVDCDTVSLTNLNRQIQALHSTLSLPKTEAMARRLADISPTCRLSPLLLRYSAETREVLFARHYDYIVDAIDLVSAKLDLIETALSRKVPIISALGTGNKLHPSLFQITDLSKTQGCPLARVIRKELRARGILHHWVLYSPELPTDPLQAEAPPPGRRSVPGSVPWTPPVAGFLLAEAVVMDLIKPDV